MTVEHNDDQTSTESSTYISSIGLKNFRCFESLDIDFDQRLTVLIARNGGGKTAILDAIAVAFGTFVGSFYSGHRTGIHNDDVRLRLTDPTLWKMEPQYPVEISATGVVDGRQITWKRFLNTPKSGTTIKEAKALTEIANTLQHAVSSVQECRLPLVAYYGTGRLWKQKKKTEKKIFASSFFSRTAGYQDCLDPASSYKLFEDWYQYAARADDEARRRAPIADSLDSAEESAYGELICAISAAVNECLQDTGWRNLQYSFLRQAIVMEHASLGQLEVRKLSDGLRNVIALVGDIAYRMVLLNGDLGRFAAKQTPGIVLIDEVDMHLHPEWQQSILGCLQRAFPCIQFIVTTHSPQVVSTVHKSNVRAIGENIDNQVVASIPIEDSYGRSNSNVLEAVMGVNPEPNIPESAMLEQYLQIIEQGDWRSGEASRLRQDLEQTLGPSHPKLHRADMTIRRREALEG